MAFPSQTRPDSLSQSATARARALALAGIVGPIWFTTLVVLQGFLQPDYSHVRLPISALGAWPTGWIQSLNFYVTGALGMAFALALHRGVQLERRVGDPESRCWSSVESASCSAGLFPWKMVDGVPTETPPHVIGAITGLRRRRAGPDCVLATHDRRPPMA